MKIFKGYNNQIMDIDQAVTEEINYRWLDSGKLENIESAVIRCAEAFGKLIELLHSKNVLNDDDVMSFLTSSYSKIEEK